MPSLMINDNRDQPWLLDINTPVKDCCTSILLLLPSSPRAKHLSPLSPAARWFEAPGPGYAESCWAPEGWDPCEVEELQKQLCAGALQALPSPPDTLTASATKGCVPHLQLIQASQRQGWCFWQGRGKHHLFRLCFPNSGGS